MMGYGHVEDRNVCPICNSDRVETLLELSGVPVYCNVLYPTYEGAHSARRGDIHLGYCSKCGHLFNRAFSPSLMDYDINYENSLHGSRRFRSYAEELAADLIDRYALQGKSVVEIACGKGEFLRHLCQVGQCQGTGFDPSYVPVAGGMETDEKVRFVREYFDPGKYSGTDALICCRHALEHIPEPREFLEALRSGVRAAARTVLYFEVPNALYTLRDLGVWDLIYEHCSFFTPSSMRRVFELAGFRVCRLREVYDAQFLSLEAEVATPGEQIALVPGGGQTSLFSNVEGFRDSFLRKVSSWEKQLEQLVANGEKIVVWGGGSKGVTFLNLIQPGESVRYVVDVNPRKQGKYIPGSGQQVIAPIDLLNYRPSTVIVMNPIYKEEIENTLKEMKLNSKIMIA